jgi:hypothetical protein
MSESSDSQTPEQVVNVGKSSLPPSVDVEPVELDQPAAPTEAVTDPPTDHEPDDANQEAKKYRHRLRESEARAEQLAAQVESLQRQHVEALAAAAGLKTAALWAVTNLEDLVDDDGSVSTELVTAAVTAASETLGVRPKPTRHGLFVPAEGNNPGTSSPSGRDAWDAQFKPTSSR